MSTPEPRAAEPDTLPSATPPPESRGTKVVVAALGALLLFGPWAAYAAGARSDPVPGENRALSARPGLDGFETFPDVTQYAADRFPLRDAAIRANKELIGKVFGEDPSYAGSAGTQQVLLGDKGWLYFLDDFNRACRPEMPLAEVLAGVKRLDTMLSASGRKLVLVVPPDKSTSDPQYLPKNFELRACSERAKRERWQKLRGLGLDGFVDVRAAIEEQERRTGRPAFLPYDTHWTQESAITFVQSVAKELDPGLLEHTSVRKGIVAKQQGDLEVLKGNPGFFEEQTLDLVREGVVSESTTDELGAVPDAYRVNHFTSTSSGPATLFQPRTVWIGDSFTARALDKTWVWFRDMTRVPELTKAILAGQDASGAVVYPKALDRMVTEMAGSEVVVVELVERTFAGAGGFGSMWTTAFLDRVQQALDAAGPR